jgi:hypothetical protein
VYINSHHIHIFYEYDEDVYVIGARTHTWQYGAFNAPQWQDEAIPYNSQRGGPIRGRIPIPRPNVQWLRYPRDRGHIMNEVYIDMDGYQVQHPQRWNMYQEGEHHG